MSIHEIKDRHLGQTIWSGEASSMVDAVLRATDAGVSLAEANLYRASLCGASLVAADLTDADLSGADRA